MLIGTNGDLPEMSILKRIAACHWLPQSHVLPVNFHIAQVFG